MKNIDTEGHLESMLKESFQSDVHIDKHFKETFGAKLKSEALNKFVVSTDMIQKNIVQSKSKRSFLRRFLFASLGVLVILLLVIAFVSAGMNVGVHSYQKSVSRNVANLSLKQGIVTLSATGNSYVGVGLYNGGLAHDYSNQLTCSGGSCWQ
jgi:hypothetical protein